MHFNAVASICRMFVSWRKQGITLYAKIILLTGHHYFPPIPRKSAAQSRHLCLHGMQCCSSGTWRGQWAVFIVHVWCSSHSPISYIKQHGFSQQGALLCTDLCSCLCPPAKLSVPATAQKVQYLNRMVVCASAQTGCIYKLPLLWACQGQAWHQKLEQKAFLQRDFFWTLWL